MRTFARESKSSQRSNSKAPPSKLADGFNQIPVHRAMGTHQTKLSVSEPGDRYEQEADRRADQVMRVEQPSGSSNRDVFSNTEAATRLSAAHSSNSGKALEPEDRQFFESRFSHNFADVQVYADGEANESALGLQARAYTVGNKISFGPGEYRPGTSEGRHLLAHELSHVIQQRSISRPDFPIIQRQPQTAPKQTPTATPKTLKDEGVDLDNPVAAKTPEIIDAVLQRNRRLAPYIGDKLKSGFSIAEKGKFVKELTDTAFETSYNKAYGLQPTAMVPKDKLGFYDYKTSEVHLRPDAGFGTALHESVHRLAGPMYSGYLKVAQQVSGDLVDVLVEGVTAFFTDCILRDEGLTDFIDAYRGKKDKAETLVKALGTDGFDLLATFNFKATGIMEIGNKLGLSNQKFSELKGQGIKEVFKRINDLF